MIGIFDSGIGGLTVAKEIKKANPNCPIVYFGDSARYPWGDKSSDVIRGYAVEITEFLISRGARDIVIACNTASTFAADFLRKKYPKINFYDVIDPVVARVEKERSLKRKLKIGVIGTRGTIGSGVYAKKIKALDKVMKVYSRACPLFVPLVEEGLLSGKVTKLVVEKYLKDLKKKRLNMLVLGCTHYPLLKRMIEGYLGKDVQIISSAQEIAQGTKKIFSGKGKKVQQDVYYFSDLVEHYQKNIFQILGQKVIIKKQVF
ncbi:MAG: glutamate racemase [Parcubacteria group bacterium]|jgi:glutamate racemase